MNGICEKRRKELKVFKCTVYIGFNIIAGVNSGSAYRHRECSLVYVLKWLRGLRLLLLLFYFRPMGGDWLHKLLLLFAGVFQDDNATCVKLERTEYDQTVCFH